MYNCFDIAKEFMQLAKKDGDVVDPMKLLKLTYIAHGWYLGFYNKPLFSNQVQAWKYGAVIPDLYHVIKRFGNGEVDNSVLDLYSENELVVEDRNFIRIIWEKYKGLSGIQLSEKTHAPGSPWSTTFNGYRNVPIPNSVIEEFYKSIIEKGREQNR